MGPTTAEQFMALPVGSSLDKGQAFFVADDTVMTCIDGDGVGWKLQQRPNGEWFRAKA